MSFKFLTSVKILDALNSVNNITYNTFRFYLDFLD
jgi:hypothetical protein